MNQIVVSGRLVREPELRYAPSGTAILNNAVANETYDKREENDRKVNFFDFVVFGNFAEMLARKLVKGDNIVVGGELIQRTWETDDGQKRSAVEINARQVEGEFKFRKDDEAAALRAEKASGPSADAAEAAAPATVEPPAEGETAAPASDGAPAEVAADDDIPF